MNCRCEHADWDHYKGKCFGWNEDLSVCKCKSFREVKTENSEK